MPFISQLRDPGRSRFAISLFGVLVLAKLLVLAEARVAITVSPWWPVAYFWQDVAVALAAAILVGSNFNSASRLGRATSFAYVILYAIVVAYVAVNVPITFVLGSPMTWTMIRAAGAPLADSISQYLTLPLLGSAAAVIAAGAALPLALRRSQKRVPISFLIFLLIGAGAIVIAGPFASHRIDTLGLDRNAMTALLPRVLPQRSSEVPANIRASPFGAEPSPDLSRYRASAKGLNVIVVVLESTAARYLRTYGAGEDPMPNLTALARHALVFDNAYAVYPESVKGLYATMCGRYPAFGVDGETQAAFPCMPVASAFREAGYRTGLFHSGRFRYLGMETLLARKGFDVLEDAGAIGGHVESSFGVDEPSTVARVLSWIDAKAGAPFFAMYLPAAGHHPYASSKPGPFPVTTEIDRYRNAIHGGDAALGALIEGLRARRLDDRTMLVIFGDHGEAFEQHPGNIGHTLQLYDENVRVPYVIAIPGVTTTETRVARAASLIDTAPTLLDLAGLAPLRQAQGRPATGQHGVSLLAPGSRMALFFTDYSLGWLGLRDGCWKYLYEMGARRSKLFDVCADPDETRDISASQPERVRAYSERVQLWIGIKQP